MRKRLAISVAALLAATPVWFAGSNAGATSGSKAEQSGEQEYVVLYAEGVSVDQARAVVAAAGATIVSENTEVGVATVASADANFATAAAEQPALAGVARNRIVGEVPHDAASPDAIAKSDPAESELQNAVSTSSSAGSAKKAVAGDPLASSQWDMQQIGATADGSYRFQQGDRGVLVGVLDTGIDASHPDIAPNFNRELSRNFTKDIPFDANGAEIDGPCVDEPDQSCDDPPDVDEDGHGTHVASTIVAPLNGIGIAGVAPKVTLVNLRAGQDSGFFFLQPSVDALTYAGDIGVDVVNMSYYIDPWLFNCADNPADSPADQMEQRTIVTAVQRALDYAHRHGVTLISAAGNGATDYTKVIADASSPDFADTVGEAPRPRVNLNPDTCISMPSEGKHVIDVSATGISTWKSYYSDYGNGYIDVAAPGGDVYDTPDNKRDITKAVLAAYPQSLAIANGQLNPDGTPNTPSVVRNCDAAGTCAYYQYLQGTSMASPHAVGVAALIVSQFGYRDFRHGGKTLPPDVVEFILKATAKGTPCPNPRAFTYTRLVLQANGTFNTVTATHTCEGNRFSNGFYGSGIVNALRAIGRF